jgi:hypothetical protein
MSFFAKRHVKLNPVFLDTRNIKQAEGSFRQQTGLKFEEKTSKVLHLENSFVWCWNSDTSKLDQNTWKGL